MAEAQDAPTQDIAPTHQDVRSTFSNLQVALCVGLGTVAITVGVVLGIVLVND